MFKPHLARRTFRLARFAYRSRDAAAAAVAEEGLTGFQFFDGPSTQGFMAEGDGMHFLAFRGTESRNPVDWSRDAAFVPKPGELDARVHSGFGQALNEVWVGVEAGLEANGHPLVVTGHSLGAGLAVLAAARAMTLGHDVAAVYLYGSPRPGLADFRAAYDQRLRAVTFSIVNHVDLVTRVPFLLQGFRHVGTRMYFDESGSFHPDASAWRIALDDLRYRVKHYGSIRSIGLGPHSLAAYGDRVDQL